MISIGKKRLGRVLAVFITVFMLMGMMPQAAFADEMPLDSTVIEQEEQTEDVQQEQQESDENLEPVPEEPLNQEEQEDFSAVPVQTSLAEEEETEYEDVAGTAYISISNDAFYIEDLNGSPIANTTVDLDNLTNVDLADYGLAEYAYDADNDGKNEITALHLYIYVHEAVLGLDWADVTVTGGPGSIYFAGGLFGYSDENLRYDYNGAYPADENGWGMTADRIVISDRDFFNVAHYTSWTFWTDSMTGFHYFRDASKEIRQHFDVEAGAETEFELVRSFSDWSNGGEAAFAEVSGVKVYYGTVYGDAAGFVTTDDNGIANIEFPAEGTWYVWCEGQIGEWGEIVSAPAFADVNVKEGETVDLDAEAAQKVADMISNIGEVTLDSEAKITAARDAYNTLTDVQKALVENYGDLEDAEGKLEMLQEEDRVAKAVAALIDGIEKVNIFSGNSIKEIREAYDALTNEQKEMVGDISKLLAAEELLANLYEEAAKADYRKIYESTGNYLENLGTPGVGSTGGEWMVIDITRDGKACPDGYYEKVVSYVNDHINDKGQLHRSKSTDNSRVILGLTAAGYDPTDVDGHNLLVGLTDMTYVKNQGINGPIWALIAFDSHGYEIPEGGDVARESLIDVILEAQLDNGGWALAGKGYDPDITGMAIQALAPYYNSRQDVKEAVDCALEMLSEIQHDNGGYSASIDGTCSESCAQVIVALTALGIDPEKDERFIKNGMSVIDAMCLFAVEDGGFAHIPNGTLNGMATEQAQYALVAYDRFLSGKTSLYDMSDVEIKAGGKGSGSEEGDKPAADAVPDTDKKDDEKTDKGVKSKTKSVKLMMKKDDKKTEKEGDPMPVQTNPSISDALEGNGGIWTWMFLGGAALAAVAVIAALRRKAK